MSQETSIKTVKIDRAARTVTDELFDKLECRLHERLANLWAALVWNQEVLPVAQNAVSDELAAIKAENMEITFSAALFIPQK